MFNSAKSMEGATTLFNPGGHCCFIGTQSELCCTQTTYFQLKRVSIKGERAVYPFLRCKIAQENHQVCRAIRRRRSNVQTDTYVLIEPGKNEEFVSVEELKTKLKYWLENWPGNTLPPDLARYRDLDDAVSHLVNSVCELEIDGEVGSIQWYQVRLE
ncbi:Protein CHLORORESPIRATORY REDUCTION 7 [Ranunculus cassubicifolius]